MDLLHYITECKNELHNFCRDREIENIGKSDINVILMAHGTVNPAGAAGVFGFSLSSQLSDFS